MRTFYSCLLAVLFFPIYASSEEVAIETIRSNPQEFVDEDVIVEGFVSQFVPEGSTSRAHYILEGKYGRKIKVNTKLKKSPEQKKRYRVEGLVLIDKSGTPYVVASSEVCLNCESAAAPSQSPIKSPSFWEENLTLIVLIAAAVILFVIIGILIRMNGRKSEPVEEEQNEQLEEFSHQKYEDQEFKTVKLNLQNMPATVRFMPGKFTVTSGTDSGKSFRVTGKNTSEGREVTIGRENAPAGEELSHIKLEDITVSRKQAILTIDSANKLFIKNISETNPTVLNGKVMSAGERIALKSGDSIKMGDIELKYTSS